MQEQLEITDRDRCTERENTSERNNAFALNVHVHVKCDAANENMMALF